MRSLFLTVCQAELLKARRSKTFIISIFFFILLGVMLGLLMYVAKHPEIAGKSSTLGTKASMISKADWPNFMNLLVQMVLAVGTIGSGIVAIWAFGREYTDRVIKDILTLPVPRYYFVLAKYILTVIWSIILMTGMFISAVSAGAVIGLDGWENTLFVKYLLLYSGSGLLTLLLTPVVAVITCAGRNLLLPIAYLLLTMIITQFSFIAVPDATLYMPWSVPALASGIAGNGLPEPGFTSYLLLCLTGIGGIAGTILIYRYSDQK